MSFAFNTADTADEAVDKVLPYVRSRWAPGIADGTVSVRRSLPGGVLGAITISTPRAVYIITLAPPVSATDGGSISGVARVKVPWGSGVVGVTDDVAFGPFTDLTLVKVLDAVEAYHRRNAPAPAAPAPVGPAPLLVAGETPREAMDKVLPVLRAHWPSATVSSTVTHAQGTRGTITLVTWRSTTIVLTLVPTALGVGGITANASRGGQHGMATGSPYDDAGFVSVLKDIEGFESPLPAASAGQPVVSARNPEAAEERVRAAHVAVEAEERTIEEGARAWGKEQADRVNGEIGPLSPEVYEETLEHYARVFERRARKALASEEGSVSSVGLVVVGLLVLGVVAAVRRLSK